MSLDKEVKEDSEQPDIRDWIPMVGVYYAGRKVFSRNWDDSRDGNHIINGLYHSFASLLPSLILIGEAYKTLT